MKPDWTTTTTDGCTLGVRVTEPRGEPLAELLLLHAMMVDARAMDRPAGEGLASTLAARGFRVHRADFRGRGMSSRPADWSYDDLVYRDLPALVRGLGGRPWVVGHSLGGHVTAASWAMGCVDIRGLVGLAANPWLASVEPSRRRRWKKGAQLLALRGAIRWTGRVPARRLRMGPVDEAATYGRDLAGFWRRGWRDSSGRDWLAALAELEGPLLMVTSDGDTLMAHPVGAEAWATTCPTAQVLRVRQGDFGLSRPPTHMGLAVDGASRPIWHAIADWMSDA